MSRLDLPAPLPGPGEPNRDDSDRWLWWFLCFVGGVSLLAFVAAVMPAGWIVATAEKLGFEPFPDSPLTFYLARNLSLLYGFVGAALLVIASDLPRYRPLVRYAWIGTLLLGGTQWVVDSMAGMPAWWVYGESLSTVAGGGLLAWLDRRRGHSTGDGVIPADHFPADHSR